MACFHWDETWPFPVAFYDTIVVTKPLSVKNLVPLNKWKGFKMNNKVYLPSQSFLFWLVIFWILKYVYFIIVYTCNSYSLLVSWFILMFFHYSDCKVNVDLICTYLLNRKIHKITLEKCQNQNQKDIYPQGAIKLTVVLKKLDGRCILVYNNNFIIIKNNLLSTFLSSKFNENWIVFKLPWLCDTHD